MDSTNWVLYNPNLPNTTIQELEIVYGSNTIKAATWGRGLWEYSLIGKNDHPSVLTTAITDMPTDFFPKENVEQFVTSVISYNDVLSNVYLEWSVNNLTFGNIINMSNTQDSTWVSDTNLPNYPIGTKMYFKVIAVGSNNDTSETYKFMYTVKVFEYCTSSGSTQWQGNVTLVDFNTIQNSTGKTLPYSDYSNTDSTTVFKGQDYDLTVNLNTDNGNYTYFAKAWIDWNQDGDFEDPGEVYDLGSSTNTLNGPTSSSPLSITIPYGAQLGKTRMRVSCMYNAYPIDCDENFDGEVEDYSIIVEDCSTNSVINPFACNSYTSPSGNYIWANSGTYNDTIFNIAGCDSLITINLSVITIDVGVTNNSPTLIANTVGANYQWLDCNNSFAVIAGETGQNFTAAENGSYAVSVSQNACTDTSLCYSISILKILENTFEVIPILYPNPSDGELSLVLGKTYQNISIIISNIAGQQIASQSYQLSSLIQFEIKEGSGIYIIEINSRQGELARFQVLIK